MITQYGENANRYSVSPSIGKYKDKQPKTYTKSDWRKNC